MNGLNFLGKLEMGLQLERLVIGIEEPVLVKDLGEIKAKIDSGNGGYNVIHGEDITYQGNYITFLTYDGAGNQKRLSKKVIEELDVHIGGGIVQKRPVIELDIKFANENYKRIPFSVTDRTENSHRILISKDFVEKTIEALIDVGAKNISNLNYDVDYKESVNEAKNEMKNMNFNDNPGADKNIEQKKTDKEVAYNPDGSKADWIDKMNDWANKWRPNGSSQLTYKRDEEAVQAWPSKAFANYGVFYKKDQQNIQQKSLMADEIKNALLQGDSSNLLIKDNKILGNKLRGISVFSYLLKKGDAGPEGKAGVVIKGQEQRRELWFTYNNDTKKAIEALEEKDAEEDFDKKQQEKVAGAGQPVDGTTEMDQRREELKAIGAGINDSFDDFFGSLLTEAENQNQQNSQKQEKNGNLITRFSKKYLSGQKGGIDDGGRSVGSKSLDAVNMKDGSTGAGDKSVTSDETLEGIKTEGERIHRLKGFIMYYIPFYNQDNSKELKTLNEKIESGSFDSDMSAFIEAGDGGNTQNAEKISIAIKKFVTSNAALLEKLPGVFALCYSDQLTKDSPRNIRFLSKESVIAAVSGEEDIDLVGKLKEMLGIPDELEETEENINVIKSLLGENSQNENENKEISIDNLKKTLNLPNALEINDENIKTINAVLGGSSQNNSQQKDEKQQDNSETGEISIDNLKKILKTPEEMIVDDNSISSLKSILDGKATSTSPEEQTGENSTEKTSNGELNVENIKKLLTTPDELGVDDTTITALKNVLGTNEQNVSQEINNNEEVSTEAQPEVEVDTRGGEEHNIAATDIKKSKSNSRKKSSSNTTKKNNTKTSKTNKTSEKSGNKKKQTKSKK